MQSHFREGISTIVVTCCLSLPLLSLRVDCHGVWCHLSVPKSKVQFSDLLPTLCAHQTDGK